MPRMAPVSLLAPISTANAPISNAHVVGIQVFVGGHYTHPTPATTTSFLELQTKLKAYYHITDKFIRRGFPNLPSLPIVNSFINVAIVERKGQQEKEQSCFKKMTEAPDEHYETYENIFKDEEKINISPKELFASGKTKYATAQALSLVCEE